MSLNSKKYSRREDSLLYLKAGLIPAFLLITLFCLPSGSLGEEYSYQYNEACQKAHKAILSYDNDAAKNHFYQISDKNLVGTYLRNYLDLLRLLSYENQAVYDSLIERQEKRLERLEKGPEHSPYHRFTKGEVHLHLALAKAKFGNYWSAGWDFVMAYRLLDNNQEAHPDFSLNKKSLYPIKAVIGTLPSQFQWIVRLLGFEGNLEKAKSAYSKIMKGYKKEPEYDAFYKEAGFIKGLMQYHLLSRPNEAWTTIDSVTKDFQNNAISAFFRANLAIRIKKKQALFATLKPYEKGDHQIPHLDYLTGNARLYRLHPAASNYFARYIKAFKGHSYVKDAYLKIAWSFLLEGRQEQYQNAMYLVKHKGQKIRGADQQAMREVDHYDQENLRLLRARLRFDGGYYRKGLLWLEQVSVATLSATKDRIEYHYRKARIHQKLEQEQKALDHYHQVSHISEEQVETYYKPAAFYYTGKILEAKGQFNKAHQNYSRVLDYSDYPYERSFSQKANAGLERIEER